jgi:hypothetical protein
MVWNKIMWKLSGRPMNDEHTCTQHTCTLVLLAGLYQTRTDLRKQKHTWSNQLFAHLWQALVARHSL